MASVTPSERFGEERTISVAVLPFVNVSRSRAALSGICAQIVTDALIHELVRTEGIRVSAPGAITPLVAQALDLPPLPENLIFSSSLKVWFTRTTISYALRQGSSVPMDF